MTIIYNKISECPILLDSSQYICPRCEGDGFNSEYDTNDDETHFRKCYICEGEGYIDWVMNCRIEEDWEEKDKEDLERYLEGAYEYWEEMEYEEGNEPGSFILDK